MMHVIECSAAIDAGSHRSPTCERQWTSASIQLEGQYRNLLQNMLSFKPHHPNIFHFEASHARFREQRSHWYIPKRLNIAFVILTNYLHLEGSHGDCSRPLTTTAALPGKQRFYTTVSVQTHPETNLMLAQTAAC